MSILKYFTLSIFTFMFIRQHLQLGMSQCELSTHLPLSSDSSELCCLYAKTGIIHLTLKTWCLVPCYHVNLAVKALRKTFMIPWSASLWSPWNATLIESSPNEPQTPSQVLRSHKYWRPFQFYEFLRSLYTIGFVHLYRSFKIIWNAHNLIRSRKRRRAESG